MNNNSLIFRPSPIPFVLGLFFVQFTLSTIIFFFLRFGESNTFISTITIAFIFRAFFIFFFLYIWLRVRYILDKNLLIKKTGILVVREDHIEITSIESIAVKQSIWGKILQFGDISLHVGSSKIFNLQAISDPQRTATLIKRSPNIFFK